MKLVTIFLILALSLLSISCHGTHGKNLRHQGLRFNPNDMRLVLYGFFEELGANKQQINETLDCLGNMTSLTHDFMQLVEAIKKLDWHNFESIFVVFKDIGVFLIEMYKEDIDCFKSMEEIAKMFEELISIGFVKLMERIKNNLQKNMKQIEVELVVLLSDFKSQKYEQVGIDFGKITVLVIFNNSKIEAKEQNVEGLQFNPEDLRLVLYGFFEELGAEGQKINETLDCLKNMTVLTHDFMQIIEAIKKMDLHNLESLIAVFKDIGIFFIEMYKENFDCFKSMGEIAKMIEELISVGPMKLIERIKTNLIKNTKKIDLEMIIMMADFKNQKYQKVGTDLGILAKYVLFENSSVVGLSMDYNSFYIMTEAILQALHVNDSKSFIACLQKKPDLYTSMQKIIEMIVKLTPINYIIYLPIIYHDIKKVYNEKISLCVNCSSDLSHDIYIIKNSKYLTDLANLWVNSIPLIKDIRNIKHNHTNPQILGLSIGDIIYQIFILNQNVTLFEGITPDDVEQFVLGFLKGMRVNVTSDITKCLKDSTDVADEVIDIINKVIHLDPANYTQILQIVNDLVQVATDILNAIKPCTTSAEDLDVIIKKIIQTPFQVILEHLAKYSLYIVADLGAAAKDALRKMYYLCGTDLGDIIYLLVLKP